MSIPLISNISQKNNGSFWLVDSNAIYGGLYHVLSEKQMKELPLIRLKPGMLCYVEEEDSYYKYENSEWILWISSGWDSEAITEEETQEIMNIFKSDTN